jgi:hypothetical protein
VSLDQDVVADANVVVDEDVGEVALKLREGANPAPLALEAQLAQLLVRPE